MPERPAIDIIATRPGDTTAAPGVIEVNFRYIILVLQRHVRLVLWVTAALTGLAAFLALRSPRAYAAQALVRVQDARTAMTSGIVDPTALDPDRVATDPILSEVQVLTSRSLGGEVVDRADATSLRLYAHGFPFALLSHVQLPQVDAIDSLYLGFGQHEFTVASGSTSRRARYGALVDIGGARFTIDSQPDAREGLLVIVSRSAGIDSLLDQLSVVPRHATNAIDVAYTARDPWIAQRIVNATVEVYQAASARAAQAQARRRRVFIESQLQQNDSILNAAQAALSRFRGHEEAYSARDRFVAEQQGLIGLDVRRGELVAERQVYQALLADLMRDNGAGASAKLRALVISPEISANPIVSQIYAQLLRYETTRDSLTTGEWRSAAGSPDVQRLTSLIATSRGQLVSAVQGYIASLDTRAKVIDELKAASSAAFQRLPEAEVEEARLATRLDALRTVGDQLRAEYEKARIDEAAEVGQLQIVDLAPLPVQPVGFGPVVKLMLGMLLGLCLGGGSAFLKEHLNTTIRGRDEVTELLQLRGLGVIPQIAPRSWVRRRLAWASGHVRQRLHHRGTGLLAKALSDLPGATSPRDPAFAADAYRILRTNLAFSRASEPMKTIAVTSPAPQEGKTTTATNLAVAFAEHDLRVLLIDCDLRRPRLHRLFRAARSPGLTELVMGSTTPEQVIRTTSTGLSILPAGATPPNPTAVLGGLRAQAVFDGLAERYDLVVLDCPPVLLGADAAILATRVDGVLLVLRAGQTARVAALDALAQLHTVGARVVGAVLNDPDSQVDDYRSYKAYRYYYYEPSH